MRNVASFVANCSQYLAFQTNKKTQPRANTFHHLDYIIKNDKKLTGLKILKATRWDVGFC